MATPAILSDVAALYKRLLNHRPVIQNEVQYFVKEFETKQEHSDLKMLQSAMMMANEIDAIFLEEISASATYFKRIREKAEDVNTLCSEILSEETEDLSLSETAQAQFDAHVEKHCSKLQLEQEEFDAKHALEMTELREKIRTVREIRARSRSLTSSVASGASVTIFSSSPPSPASREGSEGGEGGEGGEMEDVVEEQRSEEDSKVAADVVDEARSDS